MIVEFRNLFLLILSATPESVLAAGKRYAVEDEGQGFSFFDILFPILLIAVLFLLAAWCSSGDRKKNNDDIRGKSASNKVPGHTVSGQYYSTAISVIPRNKSEEEKKQEFIRQKKREEEKERINREFDLRISASKIAEEIKHPMDMKIKKILYPLLGLSSGCSLGGLILGLLFEVKSMLLVIGFAGFFCTLVVWFIMASYNKKQFNKKLKSYINSHPNEEHIKYLEVLADR